MYTYQGSTIDGKWNIGYETWFDTGLQKEN
jgi:hypothetical protein